MKLYFVQVNNTVVKEFENYTCAKRAFLKLIERYIDKTDMSILLIRNADDYQTICEFYN